LHVFLLLAQPVGGFPYCRCGKSDRNKEAERGSYSLDYASTTMDLESDGKKVNRVCFDINTQDCDSSLRCCNAGIFKVEWKISEWIKLACWGVGALGGGRVTVDG
jgi:hypothetical protein